MVQIGIGVGNGFETDADGYISYARGSGYGGHAVTGCGLKKADGKWWILIANSWGESWGKKGFAWIESKFLTASDYQDMWVAVVTSIAPTDRAYSPVSDSSDSAAEIETPPAVAPKQSPCSSGNCPSGVCPSGNGGGGRRGLFGRGW